MYVESKFQETRRRYHLIIRTLCYKGVRYLTALIFVCVRSLVCVVPLVDVPLPQGRVIAIVPSSHPFFYSPPNLLLLEYKG